MQLFFCFGAQFPVFCVIMPLMNTFDELPILDGIKRSLAERGFTSPTPVQSAVLPVMLSGEDCVALAPTGSGKTLAFGIPIVEKVTPDEFCTQALVLCPTRELTLQTEAELRKLTAYVEGVRIIAVYGGQHIEKQLYALRRKPQIVVGTTGRIMDHLRRRTLSLDKVTTVVLDEADEMLDMGFREDIVTILSYMQGQQTQLTMFSATFRDEIREISAGFQHEPVSIETYTEEEKPKITQYVVRLRSYSKIKAFERIIEDTGVKKLLVFRNTKRGVDELTAELLKKGYSVAALHGDLLQRQRDKVMRAYRSKEIDVLVATDVAARGIDVDDIEAIFNYDVPLNEEYYLHRIGRTARASKEGVAYTFATSDDFHRIKDFEKIAETHISDLFLEGLTVATIGVPKKVDSRGRAAAADRTGAPKNRDNEATRRKDAERRAEREKAERGAYLDFDGSGEQNGDFQGVEKNRSRGSRNTGARGDRSTAPRTTERYSRPNGNSRGGSRPNAEGHGESRGKRYAEEPPQGKIYGRSGAPNRASGANGDDFGGKNASPNRGNRKDNRTDSRRPSDNGGNSDSYKGKKPYDGKGTGTKPGGKKAYDGERGGSSERQPRGTAKKYTQTDSDGFRKRKK